MLYITWNKSVDPKYIPFIKELKALSGNKVNSASADVLIQFAQETMARL